MPFSPESNVAILGFGREGISTYRYLKKKGIQNITILDKREIDAFGQVERDILGTEAHILGETYLDRLELYDTIIKAPGISPYHEKILPYRQKLSSQTQMFFEAFRGRVIAVTGTKGKSTTTSLIYTILRDAGYNVGLVGNIGNPVLDTLEENYEYVIFEMSSYMLDGINIDPYISVIVNIYSEHLDYHRGFENYKNAKLSIIGKNSYIVYPKNLEDMMSKFDNQKISFGKNGESTIINENFSLSEKSLFSITGVQLLGEHNLENIMATLAVANYMDIPVASQERTITHFKGLPHRLEYVKNKNGIDFYDDAISTTPESTIAAINSINTIETIFLGGSDRGYDFSALAERILGSEIRNIVFFPDTGERIREQIVEQCLDFIEQYRTLSTRSMQEAVEFAFANTSPGKSCILSCASPSYSLWKNFEAKGDEFQKYINEHGL